MIFRSALLAAMLARAATALAGEPIVAPVKDIRSGYGVVETVSEVRLIRARSAAAGASAKDERDAHPVYRLRIRMADGDVQYRDLDRPEFKAGDKVRLTNVGEVLPDQ